MNIKILITGGTIDVYKIVNQRYIFSDTYIPQMLIQSRSKLDMSYDQLFMKDSLYTNDDDRKQILHACQNCTEDKIVITHGTDSMVETARILGESHIKKTIILLGAIVPFNKKRSDAMFNLGCAIGVVQVLPPNVYITMNGKIFTWDNVRKNLETKVFETIK